MRTSPTQFDILVTYMEQNGDVNKPAAHPRAKLESLQHWTELTALLNSDNTGESKKIDKWKKVWSDLKNNTKRKAARIRASFADGGPVTHSKLSQLEERVLRVIKSEASTGIRVIPEARLRQIEKVTTLPLKIEVTPEQCPQIDPASTQTVELVQILSEDWDQTSTSNINNNLNPVKSEPQSIDEPSSPPQIHYRRPLRKHTKQSTYVHRINQRLKSQARWQREQAANEKERLRLRVIELEQERMKIENEKTHLELRAKEVELQEKWQRIVAQVVVAVNNFVRDKVT